MTMQNITVGGKTWKYHALNDGEGFEIISLFDDGGMLIRDFYSADDMTEWLIDQASMERKKGKEKIQSAFMQRIEKLKGDMSDAQFSRFLGMKYETCNQYLTGRRFPTVYAMAQIADKCGVTVDWLIGRDIIA